MKRGDVSRRQRLVDPIRISFYGWSRAHRYRRRLLGEPFGPDDFAKFREHAPKF